MAKLLPTAAMPSSTGRVRIPNTQLLSLGISTVTIHIGTALHQRTFLLDTALLTSRSRFFTKALHGTFKEADEQKVALPNDDPEIFALYIHLLHTSQIPSITDPDRGEFDLLASIFVLAEKLQDTRSKNLVVDAILEKSRGAEFKFPGVKAVEIIYAGTAGPCEVRVLLVDFYYWRGSEDYLRKCMAWFPREFVEDLALRAHDWGEDTVNDPTKDCENETYHEDVETEE